VRKGSPAGVAIKNRESSEFLRQTAFYVFIHIPKEDMLRPVILLIFISVAIAGCIVLPASDTGSDSRRHIENAATLFLKAGDTKRQDVIDRLGTPDIIWETERIHVYRSERVVGRVIWALPVGPYSATGGITDARERHVLLIRFDPTDKVERFGLLEQGFFESLGEIMRRWHAAGKSSAPRSANGKPQGQDDGGQAR